MQKKIYKKTLLWIFILLGVFLPYGNMVFAINLEVQYPTISGQILGPNTPLPDYVKYLFNFGTFIGFFAVFISFIIAGAMYFLSPVDVDMRTRAKDRVSGAISGLLILAMTYLIITTINPQFRILTMNSLPSSPETPPQNSKPAGVYFYKNSGDCPNNPAQLSATSNISDFGNLKNTILAIGMVKDEQTAYVSILYDKIGLWGKCQYIDPNKDCTTLTNAFAASASVRQYDFDPNGDGVYFYKKTCFNKVSDWNQTDNIRDLVSYCNANNGGYYRVPNSKIKEDKIYFEKLEELSFTGNSGSCTVPENEWDCVSFDEKGDCTERKCPTLGGQNISSLIINGNYSVIFAYINKDITDATQQLDSCQEFPNDEDVNKIGPQQIKWENIRNNKGVIPNYVFIIPVKN